MVAESVVGVKIYDGGALEYQAGVNENNVSKQQAWEAKLLQWSEC